MEKAAFFHGLLKYWILCVVAVANTLHWQIASIYTFKRHAKLYLSQSQTTKSSSEEQDAVKKEKL